MRSPGTQPAAAAEDAASRRREAVSGSGSGDLALPPPGGVANGPAPPIRAAQPRPRPAVLRALQWSVGEAKPFSPLLPRPRPRPHGLSRPLPPPSPRRRAAAPPTPRPPSPAQRFEVAGTATPSESRARREAVLRICGHRRAA